MAVLVIAALGGAAGEEIRENGERLAFEDGDAGVEEFVEVVGQHLAGEADGDAFDPLGEEQGELDGKGNRLVVAFVVGFGPEGGLGIESGFQGELRKPGLDVTGGGGGIAGDDVAPVALHVDEELFLAEADEGVGDAGIPVGMILHRVADGVGDLVVAAVFELPHRVENAALDRLEAVVEMGNRAIKNDVGGVVDEPVLEHSVDVLQGGNVALGERELGFGGRRLRLGG